MAEDDRAATPPPPPAPAPPVHVRVHEHLALRIFERYGAFGLLFLMAGYVLTRLGSSDMPWVFQALDRYGPWAGGLVVLAWHLSNVRSDNAAFMRAVTDGVRRVEEAQGKTLAAVGDLVMLLRGPVTVAPPPPRPSEEGGPTSGKGKGKGGAVGPARGPSRPPPEPRPKPAG